MEQAFQLFLQQLINGIQLGSIYALIAIGYTIVYGVLQFINFAHGDVYMVGAYMGMFTVLGFTAASVNRQAIVVVLAMILIVSLLVSMRGKWRNPKAAGIRFAGFGIAFALLGAFVNAFLFVGFRVFAGIHGIAAHSVIAGGLIALIISIVWCALLGLVIERTAYKPVRGTGRLTALITAIGVSLLLQNGGQAVFGPASRSYTIATLPGGQHFVGDSWRIPIGAISLSINRGQVIILVVSVVLVAMLVYIVQHTRMGRAMRAVSFDRETAALMGINTDKVIAFTFLLGSALAGAGGFLNFGLTQFSFTTQVGNNFGLKAFVAAVLGGIGSLNGAVVGGLIMGLAETYVAGSPFSSYKDAIAYIILIVILLFRPAGLMGRYTVEKV